MKLSILAVAASLALAACGTTVGPPADVIVVNRPPVPAGTTTISEAAQKALYAAEAAYNVPAQAYVTLNRSGRLPADVKAKAKPLLQQAYQGLKLARQAAAAGDTVGVMFQAGEAQRLAAAAKALLPAQ